MFTIEQFREIARIVAKKKPEAAARFGVLRREICDLLINSGMTDDGTQYGREFRELADEAIDHSERARRFRRIATAANPRKPALYTRNMMAELYLELRQSGRPPAKPKTVASLRLPGALAAWSDVEIKQAARHLAMFHKAQVQRGPRIKVKLDTVVEELAEIFAMITGFENHRHSLPYADDSHFIQFCRAVLAPHVTPSSEATLKALSRRWKRLQDDASRPAEPVKRAPKRRLRPRKRSKATAA